MKNKIQHLADFLFGKSADFRTPLTYLTASILILSIILIGVNLLFVWNGFYFTGDTISYFDYAVQARPGNILQVFIIHSELWPPLTALCFNLLKILFHNTYQLHHIYVISIFLSTLFVVYKITAIFTTNKAIQLSATAICLFGSVQAYLFRSAIAESLFVLIWLVSIYGLVSFINTNKEKYAFLFIFSSMLLPLARYIGIGILIIQSLIFAYFVFFRNRQLKYKFLILMNSLVLIFLPIGLYLFKNKVATQVFMRSGDPQLVKASLFSFFLEQNYSFIGDMTLPIIVMFFLGAQVIWNKSSRIWVFVITASLVFYQGFLLASISKYRIIENFPSRFTSPTYPLLLLLVLLIGSFATYRLRYFRKFAFLGLIITIIFLGRQISLAAQRFNIEATSGFTFVQEPKYTKQVMDLCNISPGNKRYIFIQGSSRNWVGQSLRYYCSPITQISADSISYDLPKDSIVLTPYPLQSSSLEDMTPNEKPIYPSVYNMGGKTDIKVYRVNKNTQLDVAGTVKTLKLLD